MKFSTNTVLKAMILLFMTIAGLYYAQDFLMPLAVGGVLATLFLPISRWLESKGVPRAVAVLSCLLIILVVLAGISTLIGWQISALTDDMTLIKQNLTATLDSIQDYILKHAGMSLEKQSEILNKQQSMFAGLITGTAGSLANVFTYLILILVYVVFLLYYRGHIKQFLLKLAPSEKRNEMNVIVNSIAKVSQQYLTGLSKMIVCLWLMYGVGFSIVGAHNALFFAFLCGILEIIPFVGNITGTILTVLVTAVHGGSPGTILAILCVYGAVQFIQGWVLEPIIVGGQVKINGLFSIIALIAGELVWGIPGIFLAIPLIAMLKIICDNIEALRPYGFLIGETETAAGKISFTEKIKKLFKKGN